MEEKTVTKKVKKKSVKKVSKKSSSASKPLKTLVIVESPAKAKTIRKYLGRNFDVRSSIGHIRDLPKSTLGVDVDNDFKIKLVTIKGKAPVIKELQSAAKKADRVLLAPDPDREGEAIAQHIFDVLKKPDKVYRIMFNEITKKAIKEAIEKPFEINTNRVHAQQARRVLDRIVGYKLSPLLWDKVRSGLSAGRVQSVAMRVILEREKEIEAFVVKEYWSIKALLNPDGKKEDDFEAKLHFIDGKKFEIDNQKDADEAVEGIKKENFSVTSVVKKDKKRNTLAPFITSTMQQVASQRFRYGAQRTMRFAQKLYEGVDIGGDTVGLITYMRTDSTRIAEEAITEVREFVTTNYGEEFLPEKPNTFKVKKSAQEGHEAIRPTSVSRTPDSLRQYLTAEEFKLYDIIWKRFVASQMSQAIISTLTVDSSAGRYTLRASGSNVKFQGFLKVYGDSNTDKDDEKRVPDIDEGAKLTTNEVTPKQHFTQPPPRYTEANLIRELEEKGIGRPSTYASIMGTIQSRDYAEAIERRLHPTELGKLITEILMEHFPKIMDVGFTADMEETLDAIEQGDKDWVHVMKDYYEPFSDALIAAEKNMKNYKSEVSADEICDKCGKPMTVKFGRFGRFLACSGYPECKSTKQIGKNGVGASADPVKTGEKCGVCKDGDMMIRSGRFGKFIACSNYPKCKTTKPFTLGIKCPKGCGGEIVERRTKKGRTFYGCEKYPDCDFTSWSKPFDHKCDDCGKEYLVFSKAMDIKTLLLKCPDKECSFTKIVEKEEETNQKKETGKTPD